MPSEKHIAIVGGAASWQAAPFGCPDWTIWAVATTFNKIERRHVHAWFEIHDPSEWTPDQIACVEGHGREVPVYLRDDLVDQYPNALPYPRASLLAAFGDEFFTSTIAWMMAQALLAGSGDIGLYGVEMCMEDEYGGQMIGCKHFMALARTIGRRIVLPPGCNLERPGRIYPDIHETAARLHVAKEADRLGKQIAMLDQQIAALQQQRATLAGGREAYQHLIQNNWV